MNEKIEIIQESNNTLAMNPKKFALWLFMVSIVMIFGALTSAYIVRQSEGNWLVFELPPAFYASTAVILASSATIHMAVLQARKDNLQALKLLVGISFVLGLAFLFTQWQGWLNLVANGVFFAGEQSNPGGSFAYVLSGLHGAHIISGLIYLLIVLIAVFRYKIHSRRMLQLEMCASYWHFLDILWVYLFVFQLVTRA